MNKQFRYHSLLAFFVGLWIMSLLIIVAPFDVSDVSFKNRIYMMPPYGAIFSLSYLLISFFELRYNLINWMGQASLELLVLISIFVLNLYPVYLYYTSSFVLGEYEFIKFLSHIYLSLFFIVAPIILVSRWLIQNRIDLNSKSNKKKIVTIGRSKYDKINLELDNLVYIKSADNYIEVYYLTNNELRKKLVRLTLKELNSQVKELIQIHRSFLINPNHYVSRIDRKTIELSVTKVPISEKYFSNISKIENLTT